MILGVVLSGGIRAIVRGVAHFGRVVDVLARLTARGQVVEAVVFVHLFRIVVIMGEIRWLRCQNFVVCSRIESLNLRHIGL